MGKTLYEITESIQWIEDYLDEAEENGEQFSEDKQHKILNFLDDIESSRDSKLDGYAYLVRKLESEANTAAEEYERWRAKAESRKRRVDWLKHVLRLHMQAVGQRKVATGKFTFSLCKNGGREPLDIQVGELPEDYLKYLDPVPDGEKIRNHLSDGVEIPGVKVLPRGEHVRVR